ncbi:UPF0729 protein AAEL015238 [Bradysia coprophila]|uniref:UPF0729 protein AAEL015238 n=1 Tax=Bradysia coprophila TaxID=38358 RepID=UPI00187D9A9B|nr:UPF0729 protein AAEL015238 [Bradysia coprophila]
MVCVPCFIIPVLLFIWHRFIQPIVLRYWNPWAVKDEHGNVVENKKPEFPFQCAGGQCPFPMKKSLATTAENNETNGNNGELIQDSTDGTNKSDECKKVD